MRDKENLPRKIAQDIDAVRRVCDLIGELSQDDKELVCWITAEDVEQMKRRKSNGNESNSQTESGIKN